ncbi:MAG TPA: hypothetical protein VKA21_04220 [Candidatus Binatia bacterium]|nr:hypothetical protein [Candidatus Binatia bacterium]
MVERADRVILGARLERHGWQYARQYFGATRDGRRVILVRAVCLVGETDDAWWKRSPAHLLDGADCVFQGDVDPVSFELSHVEWGTPGPP